ncbi:hypothetical protein, partial [Mesorhizobium sp. M4B.F.Ca.ET.169.01.1.1]|uniref:hypothetical protein n=1 Tax=Mesorhizobium sp. M4B.F.Ca.ET.169.01.1.1 TaxID=2563949 RepID=UPI00167BCF34
SAEHVEARAFGGSELRHIVEQISGRGAISQRAVSQQPGSEDKRLAIGAQNMRARKELLCAMTVPANV